MKKFLSMALALIMVLTLLTSMSVAAADEPYQTNVDIIVKTASSLSRGNGPSGYKAEKDGDISYTRVYLTDSDITNFISGGNESTGFADLARVRASVNISFPVKAGKEYFVKFDARRNSNGTSSAVTSGYDYSRYDFTPAGSSSVSSYGDFGPTHTYPEQNGNWGTVCITTAAASFLDSNKFKEDGTNKVAYFKMSDFQSALTSIMQETKAYHGTGFTKAGAASYKFDITEADVCATHTFATPVATGVEGVSYMAANGKKYVNLTTAQITEKGLSTDEYTSVYGTWNASEDCSPLKCVCGAADCKTTQKTAAATAQLKTLSFDFSNIRAVVKGNIYNNDTVTAGSHGKVEIIADAGASQVVNTGETKNVLTNDCLDVVIKPVPDNGYGVDTITVDGEAVTLADDGTYTIPVSEAAEANEIEVTFAGGAVNYTAQREMVDYFLGGKALYLDGTKKGHSYTSKNGLVQMYLQNSDTYASETAINETEGYIEWKHNSKTRYPGEPGYPDTGDGINPVTLGEGSSRLYIDFNFKAASDRDIDFYLDMTNIGTEAATFPHSQWGKMNNIVIMDPSATDSVTFSGYPSVARTVSGLAAGTSDRTMFHAFQILKSKKLLHSYDGTSAFYGDPASIQITHQMPYGTLPRFYGAKVVETITYHNVVMDIGEGSASVVNHTLNYGDETITLTNGESFGIESGMGAEIAINAPSGKVIDTIVWTPVSGDPIDFSEEAAGNVSASVSLSYIVSAGTFTVTYKDSEASVQGTYDYISLSNNNTLLVSGAIYSDQYVNVVGYKDGVEYDLTGSPYLTIESDNELVFTVSDGRISTTDKFGMATITATYDNLEGEDVSATVMYQRSENAKAAGNPGSTYVVENASGHAEGLSAYSYSHVSNYNGYGCRTAFGTPRSLNWKTQPWRTMVAWFYDAGVEEQTENAQLWPFVKYYDAATGEYFSNQTGNLGVDVSNKTSYIPNAINAVPRSKGWHQAVVTVNNSGQILKYIDGILVDKINVVAGTWNGTDTEPESNLEYRCSGSGMYSDFAIVDYAPTKEEYAVTFMAENGSVSGVEKIADGKTEEYTLVPDYGFEAPATVEIYDYAGLNTQTIPVTGGKFSLTPSDNTIIKVVFAEREATVPVVKNNTAADTGAFNKAITGVDGNPVTIEAAKSVTAYATVDAGFGYTVAEYGIELEKDGKSVSLKAVGSEYEGSYAIVAYGAAIVSGSYKTRAYIKYTDAEGEVQTVYGDWATVALN